MPNRFYQQPKSLIATLQKISKRSPAKLAYLFIEDGENEKVSITYEELNNRAIIIAAYLQKQKLTGERALLLYPAGIDFITAFLGCLYAGVVAVPVGCPLPSEFKKSKELLVAIANDADVKAIITIPEMLAAASENLSTLILEKNLSLINTINFDCSLPYHPFKIDDETIAYLQYTSGSTSTPKGVIVRHKHISHTLYYTGKAWNYFKESIAFHWAPHAHGYGLLYGLLTPLYAEALAIFMPPSIFAKQPLNWLKIISKYQVTHSGAPNFGYDLCCQEAKESSLGNLNLKNWKVAVVTAEPVQYDTIVKFGNMFSPYGFSTESFFPTYGMSEAGVIASKPYENKLSTFNLRSEDLINKKVNILKDDEKNGRILVGCGRLLSGFEVQIVNPLTLKKVENEVEIGEIWLLGLPITDGYWRRSEDNIQTFKATLENDKRNYLRTGDLGFLHKGELVLTGRLKELIIIYGKNYYPLDLEISTKTAHPLTSNSLSAAFSLESEKKEGVLIVQEIKDGIGGAAALDEITQAIRQAISEQQGIDLCGVVLVRPGAIPRTASGKIQRSRCKQLYLDGKLDILKEHYKRIEKIDQLKSVAVGRNNLLKAHTKKHIVEDVLQKFQTQLISIIASVLQIKNEEIDLNISISKYGFDSLNIVRLTTNINVIYGLDLNPAIFFEYQNLSFFSLDLFNKYKDIFNVKINLLKFL